MEQYTVLLVRLCWPSAEHYMDVRSARLRSLEVCRDAFTYVNLPVYLATSVISTRRLEATHIRKAASVSYLYAVLS